MAYLFSFVCVEPKSRALLDPRCWVSKTDSIREALCIKVVFPNSQDLTQDAPAGLSFDMDYEISGFSHLTFRVGKGTLGVTAHDQIGETAKALLGPIGMDGCQRSGMARSRNRGVFALRFRALRRE
jgi:hypothetical protein